MPFDTRRIACRVYHPARGKLNVLNLIHRFNSSKDHVEKERRLNPFRSRRLVSEPQQFPYSFRFHCDSCGTGCSMVWCDTCDGKGKLLTKPGGAGVPFKIGMRRCGTCNGVGVVPCPLCGGIEVDLPPPDPDRGPTMTDDEIRTIFSVDWVSRMGER